MPCRTPSPVHAAVLFYFKVTDVCVLFPKENLKHCWFLCCCSLLFSTLICSFWSNPLTPPFGGMSYPSLTYSKMEMLMECLARHW